MRRLPLIALPLLLALAATACGPDPAKGQDRRRDRPSRGPVASSPSPSATPSPDPRIAVAGDIACDPSDPDYNGGKGRPGHCRMRATSNILVNRHFKAVLPLGDEQYEAGAYQKFLTSYRPTWGRLKSISHPVPGNHEYGTPAAGGYFAYFGKAAGPPKKGYYSYGIGSWHLIALNGNCSEVGGCGRGSAQDRWLRHDLATHARRCTLAYWHQARFSSGPHGNDATYTRFWRDLYRGGADLVLNGHDHDYERFGPQDPAGRRDVKRGIREFVVGTGGASLYPYFSIREHSQVRASGVFGVLRLTLHRGSYGWRFISLGGKFSDSGETLCH